MAERSKSISGNKSNTDHQSIFTSEFAKITRRYKEFCRQIRQLVKETNRSYNEIHEKRILPPGKLFFSLLFSLEKTIDFLHRTNVGNSIDFQ